MAVFKRIRELVSASLSEVLARAEDPEKMVNQMIREMEISIAELRKEAASAIALRKLTERRVERARREQETWLKNAETALEQGREDLARKALEKKQVCEEGLQDLESVLAEQAGMVAGFRADLRLIEEKAQEARARRETLVMKKRAALSRQRLAERLEEAGRTAGEALSAADRVTGGMGALERVEAGAEERAAEAAARSEVRKELEEADLQGTFRRMRRDGEVEQELKKLKRKLEK